MRSIESIVIVGHGVMGAAVAKTFARAGIATTVVSRRAASLDPGSDGVDIVPALPAAAPDMVLEFGPEDVATKQAIYAGIEAAYPDDQVIIATGTSGLDLCALAGRLRQPQHFIGVHYFMPADTTRVVEVMAGPAAAREVVDAVAQALERTGKEPLRLYRPTVGFLVNRLQHAILHEAYWLIQQGVATAAEIDHAARRLLAPRMCLTGLVQQKDISGLRIHAEAQRSIVPALEHSGVPNPMLQAMVARGESGLAAGRGFYDWSACDVQAVRGQTAARLEELMRFLDGIGAVGTQCARERSPAELWPEPPQ